MSELVDHVNGKLSQILDWCQFNKMILNPTKSQYILLTNKCTPDDPVIKLGDEIIERVASVKYLGVHIDEKLKYHDQIAHIRSKLRHFRGTTYRLRKYLDKNTAKKCIFQLCTPQ